jgi:hypothetical protein
VAVRVPAKRFRPSGSGDSFPRCFIGQIKGYLVQQFFRAPIRGQMDAIAEQVFLAVFTQVICHQQRSASKRLKHPHVNIVANASIKYRAGGRVGSGHIMEEALAHKVTRKSPLNQANQFFSRTRENVSNEAYVEFLF